MKLSCRFLLTAIAALAVTEVRSTASMPPPDDSLLQGDGTPGGRVLRTKKSTGVPKEDLVQASPSKP